MDDDENIQPLIEELTGSIDDLEESLAPLTTASLSTSLSKLPLLDKAKLYVLATYAIESIVFSSLRLEGVDAKKHAIFRELSRVKEYFAKIKQAEEGPAKRPATLDKGAAARFVKHGLAGNDKYDSERAERAALERAGAKRKAQQWEESARWGSQNRFENTAKRLKAEEAESSGTVTVVKADDESAEEGDTSAAEPLTRKVSSQEQAKLDKKAAKRQRRLESRMAKQSPEQHATASEVDTSPSSSSFQAGESEAPKPAPRNNHETFQALLRGPLPKVEEQVKKKRKRKSRGEMRQELEDKRAREMQ